MLKARIQKHRDKPLLFHDKCTGFFYVHYTTHGTYSFTSHTKDEAIMVRCLAQGHKCCDRPGRDSNPHFDNIRTWVQCTTPLGHDTPQLSFGHHYIHYNELYFAGLGSPEAQVRLIDRYCIVTGLGLTKDRLGGQVAWAWLGFSETWLYHDF